MAGPEPLSPEDATLSCATTTDVELQIGALCRFEGAPLRDPTGRLRIDDLRAHVASRLHLIPRFRQRVQHVPLDLARPVWVDDADFDLDRHLRTASLPAPGGTAELRRFVGDLLSRPLDPAHPLWDLWLIDGLDDGDVAVILRADHVIADGLALLDAALALLDLDAEPRPDPSQEPWRPGAPRGPVALTVTGLVDRGRHQVELTARTIRTLVDPRQVLRLTRAAVTAVVPPPQPAPRLPLTGRVGTHRDFLWATLPLAPLRDSAHTRGVTLNDIVLSAVTGALRTLLGPVTATSLAEHPPKVLVPVGGSAAGEGGNLFSFVVTGLPVHLEDPDRVVDEIHRDMQVRMSSHQSTRMLPLFSVIDVVPVALLRRVGPEILARQPLVNFAVTNLPGSEVPLYLCGSRLRELHPIISGVGNIACIIGVLSYRDHLEVGITVDPDVVHDGDGLLRALVDAADALAVPNHP